MNHKKLLFISVCLLFVSFTKSDDAARRVRSEKRIEHLYKELEKNPNNFAVNVHLGKEYRKLKKYEESAKYFQKAIELNQNHLEVFFEYGKMLYKNLGKLEEAIPVLKRAFWLSTQDALIMKYLGLCYLGLGEFDKGTRVKKVYIDLMSTKGRRIKFNNYWEGQDVNGKTICMRDCHGRGDVFMFIQHAKTLKERGATVIAMVRKNMLPMVSRCKYVDQFVENGTKLADDVIQIPFMEVPALLHKSLDEMAKSNIEVPYIFPDPALVEKWGKVLEEDKNFKIGICWDTCSYTDSKTGKPIENNRPMPLSYFYPLSKLKGVSLYCLQRYNGLGQLKDMPEDFKLTVLHRTYKNFDGTHGAFMDSAALMKNLDLVITVDTATGHLAGAMGVPVWELLPLVPDWRWFQDDETTPWYPTMRIFKQKSSNNWDDVMKDVFYELCNLLGSR